MSDTTRRHPRTLNGVNAAFLDATYASPIEHFRASFLRRLFRCLFRPLLGR